VWEIILIHNMSESESESDRVLAPEK
jgi:hypothetical protein